VPKHVGSDKEHEGGKQGWDGKGGSVWPKRMMVICGPALNNFLHTRPPDTTQASQAGSRGKSEITARTSPTAQETW
jgi:hypothetical protein